MIKAVLFDFDGVLVDSTPYHVESWKRVLQPYGLEIDPRDIYLREGSKAVEIANYLLAKGGILLSQEELERLIERKRKIYRRITRAKPQRGAEELIKRLKERGLKVGLVTGSIMKNVQRVLDSKLIRDFDVIITGEEVERAKPDPEPYLKAAQKLGLSPSECLVVENAPLGIEAAKRAGMTCIAITSTLNKEDLEGADEILEDLSQIEVV